MSAGTKIPEVKDLIASVDGEDGEESGEDQGSAHSFSQEQMRKLLPALTKAVCQLQQRPQLVIREASPVKR